MALYFFHTPEDRHSGFPVEAVELPSHAAARREAGQMCCERIRDIVGQLQDIPEWQMDVTNEAGETLFRLRFTAESLE